MAGSRHPISSPLPTSLLSSPRKVPVGDGSGKIDPNWIDLSTLIPYLKDAPGAAATVVGGSFNYLVLGSGADVASNATAIGNSSVASLNSVAVGRGANASTQGIAIGEGAAAGVNALRIGSGSSPINSLLIGGGALAPIAATNAPSVDGDTGLSVILRLSGTPASFLIKADPITSIPGLRTLGTGSQQAAAGDQVVYITGDQTINGIKTFVSSPLVPTPTTSLQAANMGYVDSQFNILSGRIGAPVADVVALRAVDTTAQPDKEVRLVEASGAIFRLDLQGVDADDGINVIAPTVGPGRWYKSQASTQDHELLIDLLGGDGTNGHWHSTLDQHAALAGTSGSPSSTNKYVTDVDVRGITKGGTGQITQTLAFNALSPLTTKGDLISRDGTNNIRVGVGTDGQVLVANSAAASGLSWGNGAHIIENPSHGSALAQRTFLTFTSDFLASDVASTYTQIALALSGVGAGTYTSVTVNNKGIVTAGTNPPANAYNLIHNPPGTSITARTTLAFTSAFSVVDDGGNTRTQVDLATSGVSAGSYNNVTVNNKGIVTAASSVSYESVLTFNTPLSRSGNVISLLTVPVNFGGTGAVTAQGARAAAGLNIDSKTLVGNSNYSIVTADRVILLNAALSGSSKTWTLPLANTFNPGQKLSIRDMVGGISATFTLTIARTSTDTVNGGTGVVLATAYDGVDLYSDGISTWSFGVSGVEIGGTGAITRTAAFNNLAPASAATGDILYFNGTNWVRLPVGTAGQVVTVAGGIPSWAAPAGASILASVGSPTALDKALAPNSCPLGTGNNQDTGKTITAAPMSGSYVMVTVNGDAYEVGNGDATKDVYFGPSSGVSHSFATIVPGDKLWWNATVTGRSLLTTDRVDFYYDVATSTVAGYTNIVTKFFADTGYVLTTGNDVVDVDCSGGNTTMVLPAASGVSGKMYRIKKIDSSAFTLTIDANGSELIDGALTISTSVQYNSFTLVSNGTKWGIY